MTLLPSMEKCPINFFTELILLLKFDNSSSSITWDKEIWQVIMRQWHHYHLRQSTQRNSFNDVYLVYKFDVSSFLVTGDISFCWLWALQCWYLFLLTLGNLKLALFCPYYWLCTDHIIWLSLGKTCHKKRFKDPLFDKNSKTTCIRSDIKVIFNYPIRRNQELFFLVNK